LSAGTAGHERRALGSAELQRLIRAAEARPLEEARGKRVHAGVSAKEEGRLLRLGRLRALVYALAAGTGLRRGELSRLRWGEVDLGRSRLVVRASSAKARREQEVPLRGDLLELLRERRPADALPTDSVFPARSFPNLRTFKRDLAAAGISRVDETGRIVDFHALRKSFVSGLVVAGVHPRTAQALARHAKLETTMGAYTDERLLDLRGAVERLPSVVQEASALVLPLVLPCVTHPHDHALTSTSAPSVAAGERRAAAGTCDA
jgi:integrase